MKVLNLYAGIGGNRKLWEDVEVTAVEMNPEVSEVYRRYFPDDNVVVGDAHQFLLDNYQDFDFIWASPPCQTHSAMARVNVKRYGLNRYPDMKLWQEILYLKEFFKGKYVVENVKPYYDPLIPPTKILNRHFFWSNFPIGNHRKENVKGFIDAKFDDVKKWLGYDDFNERIYLNGTHDYTQVLRNCVHPETGLYILDCAREIIRKENVEQLELFEQ